LSTFGDCFHDIRRKESKSQHAPYVRFAQVVFARNLGNSGIFTPAERIRPDSASRDGQDERTVKTPGR